MEKTILTAMLVILALCMLAVVVRLIRGPRIADRILAVNALNTLITVMSLVASTFAPVIAVWHLF